MSTPTPKPRKSKRDKPARLIRPASFESAPYPDSANALRDQRLLLGFTHNTVAQLLNQHKKRYVLSEQGRIPLTEEFIQQLSAIGFDAALLRAPAPQPQSPDIKGSVTAFLDAAFSLTEKAHAACPGDEDAQKRHIQSLVTRAGISAHIANPLIEIAEILLSSEPIDDPAASRLHA